METRSFFDQLPSSKRHEVEAHLDVLNKTAPQINELENKLSDARSVYHQTLSEHSNQLKALSKRLGKCIQRSRKYYELKQEQADLMRKINTAVERYNKADSTLHFSREAFAKLEHQKAYDSDADCTESLEAVNQCIWKVNSAKVEITQAKADHEDLLDRYNQAETAVRHLEKRYKKDIKKSEPYFLMKYRFDELMADEKVRVEIYEQNVSLCKSMYADTMLQLERISNSLHDARRKQSMSVTKEASFVGANDVDSDSPLSSLRGEGVGAESLECISDVDYAFCPDPSSIALSPTEKSSLTPSSISVPTFQQYCSVSCSGPTSPQLPIVTDLLKHIKNARLVFDQSFATPKSSCTSTPINSPACHSVNGASSFVSTTSHSNLVQQDAI